MLQARQKPLVDAGHLPDLLYTVATRECGMDGKNALVRGVDEFLVNVLDDISL